MLTTPALAPIVDRYEQASIDGDRDWQRQMRRWYGTNQHLLRAFDAIDTDRQNVVPPAEVQR